MTTMKKYVRDNKNCYRKAVTLTFKNPMTLKRGLYITAYMMRKTKSIHDFVLYPEYGVLGNFHLHGTMYFSNKVHFYSFMNYWRRYVGFVKFKDIDNIIAWHIYCIKDQHMVTQRRVHKYNLDDTMIRYCNK